MSGDKTDEMIGVQSATPTASELQSLKAPPASEEVEAALQWASRLLDGYVPEGDDPKGPFALLRVMRSLLLRLSSEKDQEQAAADAWKALYEKAESELTEARKLLGEAPVVLPVNSYIGDWFWRRDAFLGPPSAARRQIGLLT